MHADLWVQAASAGESYLAGALVEALPQTRPIRVLLTSNTRQGVEILDRITAGIAMRGSAVKPRVAYFPFDSPDTMKRAVGCIRPRCMVFMETEIWPGLLSALRNGAFCRTFIVNGRMTDRSYRQYRLWPSLWRHLRPDRILAVSQSDAARFGRLFGRDRVGTMPNMKFDRFGTQAPARSDRLAELVGDAAPFLVLGSVRTPEEPDVIKLIRCLLQRVPSSVIGLFPRHLFRVRPWQRRLRRAGLPYRLRSQLTPGVAPGTVVLWDTFGELNLAYEIASGAFVGGSLAPLGGQNFLEPLTAGVIPVIGPSWGNFHWIGSTLFDRGLALKGNDWQMVCELLLRSLADGHSRPSVRASARRFIRDNQGGTAYACRFIVKSLGAEVAPLRPTGGRVGP
jgi:3-deoxy-D-manno-octulosonic-acid transferase